MVACAVLVAVIVVVAVAVVVDTRSLSASLDGVLREMALDCRRCPGPFSSALMPGGDGFGPCADVATPRPRSDRWREAELSACCTAAASSSVLSCWCTHLSLEVAASGQPRGKMAAAAMFCDARLKSGVASP
jgi:hypothetical protein